MYFVLFLYQVIYDVYKYGSEIYLKLKNYSHSLSLDLQLFHILGLAIVVKMRATVTLEKGVS